MKEVFYLKYKSKKNFFYKILISIKLILGSLNLLPKKDTLYKLRYYFSNDYKGLINDYDLVICDFRLSELYNQNKKIIYETLKSKKTKLVSWVYSWDNLYQSNIIKSSDLIFVWSDYFKKIAKKIHNIDHKKIKSIGPVQLDYLKAKIKISKTKKNYILFACSYGSDFESTGDNFIKDEIEFLKILSEILKNFNSDLLILVRPYPSANPKRYNELKKINNIKIEEYGNLIKRRNISSEKIRFERRLESKINQIINASIVISFGSTFNIEASYLNKIVFHINYSPIKSDYDKFNNEMENLKILRARKYPNIINNNFELKKALNSIINHKKLKEFKNYNNYLEKIFLENFKNQNFENNLKKIFKKI